MNKLQIFNPATGELIHELPVDDATSITMKLRTARDAQPRWAATPVDERVAAMRRFRALLIEELEPLATTLMREVGMRVGFRCRPCHVHQERPQIQLDRALHLASVAD